MRTADRTLLDWLGEEGIATALRFSLNRASLVRLANARRVSIPGMRNQSVPMDRLAAALAAKFATEEASRRTLISALDTANRKLIEEWRGLSEEEAQVILRQGTERPFCGAFIDNKREGTYVCRL